MSVAHFRPLLSTLTLPPPPLIWAIAQSVRAVNSNDFPVGRRGKAEGGKSSSFLGQKATFFGHTRPCFFSGARWHIFRSRMQQEIVFPVCKNGLFPLLILLRNGWHPGALGVSPPNSPDSSPLDPPFPLPTSASTNFDVWGTKKRGGGEIWLRCGEEKKEVVGWLAVGWVERRGRMGPS